MKRDPPKSGKGIGEIQLADALPCAYSYAYKYELSDIFPSYASLFLRFEIDNHSIL